MTHNSNARKARADEPLFGGFGGAYEQLIDRVFCDFDMVQTELRTLMEHGIGAPSPPDAQTDDPHVETIRRREKAIGIAIRNLRALAAAARPLK